MKYERQIEHVRENTIFFYYLLETLIHSSLIINIMSHDTRLYLQIINRVVESWCTWLDARKTEGKGIRIRINVEQWKDALRLDCTNVRVRGEQPGGEVNILHGSEKIARRDQRISE